MRGPVSGDNGPLYNYTLMPTNMRRTFSPEELHGIDGLQEPFSFTKGCKTLRVKAGFWSGTRKDELFKTMLFDTKSDPAQLKPIDDEKIERHMKSLLVKLMKWNDAPKEQFVRLGLEKEALA